MVKLTFRRMGLGPKPHIYRYAGLWCVAFWDKKTNSARYVSRSLESACAEAKRLWGRAQRSKA